MLPLILLAGTALVAGMPASRGQQHKSRPKIGLTNVTRISHDEGLSGRAISGPQMGVDFPDPSLIFGDGSWKAYGTSSNGKTVPIATSSDAFSWTLSGDDALPDPGSWVDGRDRAVWSPDVQKNDAGQYVMYYTAHKAGGSHCIGAATSDSATGPFTPQSQPLICDDAGGGVIDASGYDDGTDRWIVWKVDGNSLGGASTCHAGDPSGGYIPTPIMIQKVDRDALSLKETPKQILDNEGASNDGVVEAPALYHAPNGEFVLFYSAHCYSSDDYDIEYAWSSTIDGTYGDRGILARTVDNIGIYGPGGIDVDPNGSNTVFHGRLNANQGNAARELYSATITFDGEHVNH